MIKIDALEKCYGDRKALDKLSLTIPSNTIYGLLGPNGAGKTTLISILNGLLSYDAGEVSVFDMSLTRYRKAIRARCSLIPQTLAFYEQLTVQENLIFFSGIQQISGKKQQNNMAYAVDTNRLGSMMDQKAATLSGGQKRRLNIAIGLLNNPDILFFDEPTVGIDPESRNEILDTIKGFKAENKTVVYTSHYMPEIEKICDSVAIINQGQIVRHGRIETMLLSDNNQQVIVELHAHSSALNLLEQQLPTLQVVDDLTLLLTQSDGPSVSALLALLEQHQIKVKQIRYGATSLESMFIKLTAKGDADV